MKNHWCSYDSTDPILVWELSVPAPAAPPAGQPPPGPQQEVVAEVCRAGRATGFVDVIGFPRAPAEGQEWLPFEDDLFGGLQVPLVSTVTVRDAQGALVQRQSADAGALLRELEVFDDVYARRFAASHPFVGLFSTSTDKTLGIHVCFFSTLYFDESDPELTAANQARLLEFRAALLAIAQKRGGRLNAPTTTTSTTKTRAQ